MSGFLELLGLERKLLDAWVSHTATLAEAMQRLGESRVGSLAVLDEGRQVVGLFGESQLLRCLFPRYLAEMTHTAFVRDDPAILSARLAEVEDDEVRAHAHEAVTVEADASATHVAERFLHSDVAAVAVVRHGRFLGMLGLADFCQAMLRLEST